MIFDSDRMRILVITPYYAPDLGPSAPLITLLCEQLAKAGHSICVITAVPHYPSGKVDSEYQKKVFHREVRNSVEVRRVWVPGGDRRSFFHRSFVFLVFQILSVFAGYSANPDRIIITNPAIETYLPFKFLRKSGKIPVLLFVWDLYPDVGIHLGLFKNPVIAWFVKKIEDDCLKDSTWIQVFSESFADKLSMRGVNKENIHIVIPWVDPVFFDPVDGENPFALSHSFSGHFVVMYAGNMGYSQALEDLIYAANELRGFSTYLFVFVGEGNNKSHLVSLSNAFHLDNIRFLPYQDISILPQVLTSADIQFVSQKPGIIDDSIPSKLFPLMASGKAILMNTLPESDAAKILQAAGAGICVPPGEIGQLVDAIVSLSNNTSQRLEMGRKAREFAIQYCHPQTASDRIETILCQTSDLE